MLGTDLIGGIWIFGFDSGWELFPGLAEEAILAVSEDPVSIWTTCLNEEVSAWTKVVGYGFAGSDLVMGRDWRGEGGGGGFVGVVVLLVLELGLWILGDGIEV